MFYVVISIVLFSCEVKSKSIIQKEGNIKEETIVNDNIYLEYHNNGNKKIEANIQNGKFNGKYIKFYKNGSIEEVGIMVDGLKNNVCKKYDQKGILIEVNQFFDDNVTLSLSVTDFLLEDTILDSNRIKLGSPIYWDRVEIENTNVLFACQKKENKSVFSPNFTLTKEDLPINFDEYLKKNIEILENSLPFFKRIGQGNLIINNLPAYQISYLMLINGVKLGGVTTWINNNGVIYVITGIAINEVDGEFLKYKGLFQEISRTFRRK